MILVDTSVWVDHLQGSERSLPMGSLLHGGEVLVHPFVLGELALGSLGRKRREVLASLRLLSPAPVASSDELLEMIEAHRLTGTGIGWVDAHLAGSALLASAVLWTFDRRLAAAASALGIDLYHPVN